MLPIIAIRVCGKEEGKYLSHAFDKVGLQPALQGGGEFFSVEKNKDGDGTVALACLGKEEGKYLAYASTSDTVFLSQDENENVSRKWYLSDSIEVDKDIYPYSDRRVTLKCADETGRYLSHASGHVALRKDHQGEDDLWCQRNLVKTLSDVEFVEQTSAWQQLEGNKDLDAFDFFFSPITSHIIPPTVPSIIPPIISPKIISGAKLYSFAAELLLSRTSVTTIKVRFGLDISKDEKGNVLYKKFQVIFFGTDDFAEVLTPYYVAETQIKIPKLPSKPSGKGNIPAILLYKWNNYWQIRKKRAEYTNNEEYGTVNGGLFMTHYGFLRGYSYPLKEFYSLLSDSLELGQTAMPSIIIRFVLHKFSPVKEDTGVDKGYTFGLIFQSDSLPDEESSKYNDRSRINEDNLSKDQTADVNEGGDDGENVYFDLSTPCPRTC